MEKLVKLHIGGVLRYIIVMLLLFLIWIWIWRKMKVMIPLRIQTQTLVFFLSAFAILSNSITTKASNPSSNLLIQFKKSEKNQNFLFFLSLSLCYKRAGWQGRGWQCLGLKGD